MEFFQFTRYCGIHHAAKKLMESLGMEVNDLYAVSKTFPNELHSGFVHFNDKGSMLLADVVAERITQSLDITWYLLSQANACCKNAAGVCSVSSA